MIQKQSGAGVRLQTWSASATHQVKGFASSCGCQIDDHAGVSAGRQATRKSSHTVCAHVQGGVGQDELTRRQGLAQSADHLLKQQTGMKLNKGKHWLLAVHFG